ncbi:hypothetical protein K1719_021659 [Acacia pycnantha]|nr:hypothetical protein K1719_021659 [Acacia pycnantha]
MKKKNEYQRAEGATPARETDDRVGEIEQWKERRPPPGLLQPAPCESRGAIMSDKGENFRPLCTEEMNLTDQQLKLCKCGYEFNSGLLLLLIYQNHLRYWA